MSYIAYSCPASSSYILSGFGEVTQETYGNLLGSIIKDVTGSSDIMGVLSPPVRGMTQVMRMTLEKSIGKNLASVVFETIPPQAAQAIGELATSITNLVTAEVAKMLVGSAAETTISAIADMIPFISGIVSFVMDALGPGAAKGTGPASSDASERAGWCKAQYAPVRGSGELENPMYACDIFTNTSRNGYGEKTTSSIGEALRIITEGTFSDRYNESAIYHPPPPRGSGFTEIKWVTPGLGIPKHIRELFKKMRIAMELSCANPNLDGGNSLFPIYLDLLRAQFDHGRMTHDYARYLYRIYSDVFHRDIKEGDTCLDYEKRGFDQALELVRGWKNTIFPKHDPGSLKRDAIIKSEAQIVQVAKKALMMPQADLIKSASALAILRKQQPKIALPFRRFQAMRQLKTKMTAKGPVLEKKLPPAVAVGVGAGAAALALLFL